MKFLLLLLLLLFCLPIFSTKPVNTEHLPNKKLEEFLSNPLDLQQYKNERGFHCNSGSGFQEPYHYKPKYKGIYWSYFICADSIPDRNKLVMKTSQLYMMVYKKGNQIGGYMDKTDSLIQLRAKYPNKYLHKADLVRKNLEAIIMEFGTPSFESKDNFTIYQSMNNTLLILSGKILIDWFQIVRLNKRIERLEDIPKDLLEYKHIN